MANKRMFSMLIVDSDAFLDMPLSSQCLYFHLCMRADDDGFVSNPKKIQRMISASEDDLKLLVAKRFLIRFEDGVVVIKHWRMHNSIRYDRYTPTVYADDLKQLGLKPNKAYTLDVQKALATTCQPHVIPDGNQVATSGCQDDANSSYPDIGLDKDIDIVKDSSKENRDKKRFTPPTKEEIAAYCLEKDLHIDVDYFIDYYTANGWKVGRNPMKDWKATVRNWAKRDTEWQKGKQAKGSRNRFNNFEQRTYDFDQLERMLGGQQ